MHQILKRRRNDSPGELDTIITTTLSNDKYTNQRRKTTIRLQYTTGNRVSLKVEMNTIELIFGINLRNLTTPYVIITIQVNRRTWLYHSIQLSSPLRSLRSILLLTPTVLHCTQFARLAVQRQFLQSSKSCSTDIFSPANSARERLKL